MSNNTEKKIEVLNRRLGEFADAYRNFKKIGISEGIDQIRRNSSIGSILCEM